MTKLRVNDLLLRGSEFHTYQHIFETPLFVTSKNRVGLEIADAVSFCTLKHYCLHSAFTNYWDLIEPRYRRNLNNEIIGYGLKLFPS